MIVRMMLMSTFGSARGVTVVHKFLRDLLQMHMTNRTTGIRFISFVAFAEHRTKIVPDFIFKTFRQIGFGISLWFISMVFALFYRN